MALKNLFGDIPEAERITYNKEPYRSMIDFLLVSPAMADMYVKGSYEIHLQATVASGGSDHNPVVATFKLKRQKAVKIRIKYRVGACLVDGANPFIVGWIRKPDGMHMYSRRVC